MVHDFFSSTSIGSPSNLEQPWPMNTKNYEMDETLKKSSSSFSNSTQTPRQLRENELCRNSALCFGEKSPHKICNLPSTTISETWRDTNGTEHESLWENGAIPIEIPSFTGPSCDAAIKVRPAKIESVTPIYCFRLFLINAASELIVRETNAYASTIRIPGSTPWKHLSVAEVDKFYQSLYS